MRPSKKNVLLVSQFLTGGGLERMVHLLGESLARDFDCQVTFFCFENEEYPDKSRIVARLAERGVEAIHSPKTPGFSKKTLFELVSLIRTKKIDVIHTHETAPLMYAVMAKFLSLRWGARIVHTQHSFVHLQTRGKIAKYDRFFSRLANQVTVVSPQVRDTYIEMGVPASHVKWIRNGVEFPASDLDANARMDLRKTLVSRVEDRGEAAKLELGDLWLVSLARLHPGKGQDRLLEVWKELPHSARSKCRLVFVGPQTQEGQRDKLKALARLAGDEDRVVFAGSSDVPVSWLQASDLFLSGSDYEGMPLAPIEGCGAGLPLLLSDIPGHRVIEDLATLFSGAADGAKKLESILAERVQDIGHFQAKYRDKALKVRKEYSIREMTSKYFDLY